MLSERLDVPGFIAEAWSAGRASEAVVRGKDPSLGARCCGVREQED